MRGRASEKKTKNPRGHGTTPNPPAEHGLNKNNSSETGSGAVNTDWEENICGVYFCVSFLTL